MRILHVVPTYYPAYRYGGTIEAVRGLAKGLVKRGHEVHVFTTDVDGAGRLPVALNEAVFLDGVLVRYFPTGLGRRVYRSPKMGQALREEIKEFDLAHLHSVFLWPTSVAARAARAVGVPYIVAPHGMLVKELIKRKSRIAKTAWINVLEKRNIKYAAAVHVTSELEANELAGLGIRHRNTFTVPNGVDDPCSIASSDTPLIKHLPTPFVLFLGRINWKKGLDRLIPAMANVPGAMLVIAGNDEEGYRPVLQALAERLGVAARTRFVGALYGSQKWELLQRASMLVLPSYSENFGIVALEAMMAGCPVIVTPQVGLASVVRAAGAGIVAEGQPEQLSHAIDVLLQAPDQRRKMGDAGRRIARERFSWGAVACDMEEVYRVCTREGSTCSKISLQ
jgi:glycosyltransferase involved in cell wall biosynthesis